MMLRQHICGRGNRLGAEASGELPEGQLSVGRWIESACGIVWQNSESICVHGAHA